MRSSVLLALLWCAPLLAEGPATRAKVSLADVRWQSLPRGVERVFVGPDGRTWYRSDPRKSGATDVEPVATVAGIKREIERAFLEASPEVADVEILLFEPGGRVWFSFNSRGRMMLLGYDGKGWTDYTILQRGDMISGHCATRGALLEGRANRYAGGAAWFITHRGVLRFDGSRWQYQKFADQPDRPVGFGSPYPDGAVWLAVSPDGRAAVAYAGTSGAFWACRDGKWEAFDFPIHGRGLDAGSGSRRGKLHGLVMPEAQSAWVLGPTGVLQRLPPAATGGGLVDDLIAALKDDRFATREDATRQLQAMGPSIRPAMEHALGESTDPEQRLRLEAILGRVDTIGPMEIETTFGPMRVAGCRQLYEDGAGRVIATAAALNGQGSGVAILGRDGRATTLMGERFSAAWAMAYGDDRPPIFAPTGDRVWLANRGTSEPPRLLDLGREAFVDSLPHPEFSRLHAVAAGGRVFASVALPQGIRPIEVFTPGVPDAEVPLDVGRVPVLSPLWAVTDGGAVWAHGTNGPTRFDGLRWADIRPAEREQPDYLLPGKHDTMLLWSEHSATLYEGARELGAGERFAVLRQHRTPIRRAFGPGDSGGRGLGSKAADCGIRVDRAGNVWCWEPTGRLLVEVGGAWSDADEALTAAGSRAGRVTGAVLVGDGGKLYVCARDAGKAARNAFFADLKDGKPRCVPAPRDVDRFQPPRNLFDRDGGLWVGESSLTASGTFRIGRDGGVAAVRAVGLPALADEAGNVWLCDIRGPVQDNFRIWRDGRLVQELVIPGADSDTFLFSDRPGSAYAWTVAGLQHLVADGPNFDSYRLHKVHPVEGIAGQALSRAYSRHGYAAVLTASDARDGPRYHLYLVRLPK